ncbi:alpha/beta hydrolase [Olivibacter sp. SDN3]|uniref:alpha/beta fold hydrolase n=1 Tax=Olivibacter sp. SDN3 TaxID=2764720 RepID=UPI001651B105|nr:alpha/beta hydrolase [Olivibacter sp. SDN3]QNL48089.1 alpha/beta hydrolase [Olivibacter sp. SDN3]
MEKPSFKSKIYRLIIRLAGIKTKIQKQFKNGDFTKAHKAAGIPTKVKKQCDVIYRTSSTGRKVWKLKKKDTSPQRYLFFVHGGGFVYNITKYDWVFLNKIVQHTDIGIVVPDYPLTPTNNYQDVFDMVVPVYADLVSSAGGENVILMGFSAGGGIALSLAQHAQKQRLQQPSHIILLSPLLDATIQHPEIQEIDQYDPYIDVKGMKTAISAYTAGTKTDDYMISPIYGPLDGLAPIHLFMGTHEVLLPDARKFVAMAKEKSVPITYYEYKQMYHAWIFLNMPEANDVFNKLVNIIA